MLSIKYELEENMFANFVASKLKTVVNSVTRNYIKYHREWCFNRKHQLKYSFENNRQNSGELIKLPLKIINSVVFKYLYDFRELKKSLKVEFFSNRHLEFACIRNLCQQILLTD